jgi:hypothetical protein
MTTRMIHDMEPLAEGAPLELPEPGDELAGEPEEALPVVFSYDEEAPNLVEAFMAHREGVEALKEIADHCYSTFTSAFEATEKYRKKIADNWRIFTGDLPPKEAPFENTANAHLPLMLETMSRLSFRVYGELFDDPWHVFDVVPVGPDDDAIANILSTHGNWQIREQISDFQRQMHRLVLGFFVIGDVTVHSYYDELRRTNCHEVLTPDEFVTPNSVSTTRPD